ATPFTSPSGARGGQGRNERPPSVASRRRVPLLRLGRNRRNGSGRRIGSAAPSARGMGDAERRNGAARGGGEARRSDQSVIRGKGLRNRARDALPDADTKRASAWDAGPKCQSPRRWPRAFERQLSEVDVTETSPNSLTKG